MSLDSLMYDYLTRWAFWAHGHCAGGFGRLYAPDGLTPTGWTFFGDCW